MRRYRSILLVPACGLLFSHSDSGQSPIAKGTPPRVDEAPPEITILKHALDHEARLVNEMNSAGGEPTTRIGSEPVTFVSVKVRGNTLRTIVAVSWYFVLQKSNDEEYFRVPFLTPAEIEGEKTKTIKGELDMADLLRKHPQAVTVDELKNPVKTPARERIVISCLFVFRWRGFTTKRIGEC